MEEGWKVIIALIAIECQEGMKTIKLKTSLSEENITSLRAGDKILLTGQLLVARDQAHMRLIELMKAGKMLPVDLKNQIIYYAGPSPTKPGEVIGSIGPTTAARMDKIAEPLFKMGVRITIGKGERSEDFRKKVKKYKAPYLAAMGGSGAIIQQSVLASKVLAFKDLGPEAIYELTVKDMPLYVAYDVKGGNIYKH
jgi:fumarate hydratase subunit beta